MGSSIHLFSVRGIDIRMHITFPLILVWGALQFGLLAGQGLTGALFGIVVTIILFAIVVLHELGHSFAALHYGVPVKQIVLLPIGGVAQLERIPEKPIQEFVIAAAGPLVNFGLAGILALAGFLLDLPLPIRGLSSVINALSQGSFSAVFGYVFISNLFLAIFNLLPAFPMDGGRVLRAMLASRLDYVRATTISVTVGQALAWLMGLYGFLNGGFFFILIAFFIYAGASQEGRMIQIRSVLRGLTVGQAYSRDVAHLSPGSSLREAVNLTLNSFQSDFPVCDGEQLVGLLTHSRLVETLNKLGPDGLVGQIMETDFQPAQVEEELFTLQQKLAEEQRDALPVVERGRFLGLITNRDINEVYRLASSRPELLRTA
jgi:Zn-dependent protease/CBS domain-containing protein